MSATDEALNRAKLMLDTVRNAAMATVNEDGSPHNTPFHYIIDNRRQYLYWASSPESVHSQNIARTGAAFIVIYEAGQGGGLYLKATNGHELQGNEELEAGLKVWNAKRLEEGREPLEPDFVMTDAPQRMYRAELIRFWVNSSLRDSRGNITKDVRIEINRGDLV